MRQILEHNATRVVPPTNHGSNSHEESVENRGGQESESADHHGSPNKPKTSEENRNGDWCKYKDFQICKPSTFDDISDPVKVMDWIFEMEMAFATCECSEQQKTIFAVRQFKDTASRWWSSLVKTMYKGVVPTLTWQEFLTHLKKRFCSARHILQLENDLQKLKKGSKTVDEYTDTFLKTIEFAIRIVPDELSKIAAYAKGLPSDYDVAINSATTLDSAIWAARTVETMLKRKTLERSKVGEKRKSDGSFGSNKKKKFSKSTSNNKSGQGCRWWPLMEDWRRRPMMEDWRRSGGGSHALALEPGVANFQR
ncbi:hypothetical protein LXL04_024059 [Taraxacum kok-saghyz]